MSPAFDEEEPTEEFGPFIRRRAAAVDPQPRSIDDDVAEAGLTDDAPLLDLAQIEVLHDLPPEVPRRRPTELMMCLGDADVEPLSC